MMRSAQTRAVIVGAGGHARVVVDILEDQRAIQAAGFVSRSKENALYGYPRLGGDEDLPGIFASGITAAVLGIGDNRIRRAVADLLRSIGFDLVTVISKAAWVSKRSFIGPGAAVMPGAIVNAGARIGEGAIVNTSASVDHDCIVEPYAHIAPGVSLAGGARIGEGAFLGVGAKVVPEISIGAWSVIGAGAVVVRDIPKEVVAIGVPAAIREATR